MATIKMGAIVTDIRGKLGGHVFQKGNQSRVMKTKSIPQINKTASYRFSNVFVVSARDGWYALSIADRSTLGDYCKAFKYSNVFGDTLVLNAYQFYLKLHTAWLRAGWGNTFNVLSVIPVVPPTSLQSFVFNTANDTFSAIFENDSLDGRLMLYTQKLKNASIKPSFNKAIYVAGMGSDNVYSTGAYSKTQAKWGNIVAGQVFACFYVAVNNQGYSGKPQYILGESI